MLRPLLCLATAIALPSCTTKLSAPAHGRADTTATKRSLMLADSGLSHGTLNDLLRRLDSRAAVLIPGQPVLDVAAARDQLARRYEQPAQYSWRPAHAIASADGAFGCTVGYSNYRAPTEGLPDRAGAYVTCWRRHNGDWRIVAHARADSPAQAPKGAESGVLPVQPQSATAYDSREDAARVATITDGRFASMASEAAGPGPAFARFAATDGTILNAQMPVGGDQIGQMFSAYPSTRVLLWKPERAFSAGSGGLAVTVGHAVDRDRRADGAVHSHHKYITVWRRATNGEWLYVVDLGTPWK